MRLNVSEILQSPLSYPDWATDMADWLETTVSAHVPDLGRPGCLCPYVPPAIQDGGLCLVACDLSADPIEHLISAVLAFGEEFAASASTRRSDIVVFTELQADCEILTEVRTRVKPDFLRAGVTCGEFYPSSMDMSVRNAAVPVARSPWPAIALRICTPHDEIFLRQQPSLYKIFREGPGAAGGGG